MEEVRLPKLGESILSAKIVQWFKQEGERVDLDEPLLEVSTDKVNSEIPSPVSGVIRKIFAKPDDDLEVGALLCHIETGTKAEESTVKEEVPQEEPAPTQESMTHYLSPAVIRIASEAGIPLDELKKIPATGAGGRVSKKDIENYLKKRSSTPASDHEERVKMSGMRKAIAESMVKSFYQAPHATLVAEIDITNIKNSIAANKESFQKEHGCKLTITSYVAHAISQAITKFPLLNASVDHDHIVLKRHINLGIAVSVKEGILVPVIPQIDKLSHPEVAQKLADLAAKARSQTLKPDEVQGSTITMTNFGMSGVKIGIPIIHHPEVAIIGMGAIEKKVVANEDDSFGVRSVIHISLTFDHRIIDGMYGCDFLGSLKTMLEK
ncbi:MAG: dihydrolipoamide acetyltransferase family protein [Candidatus Algichlamydia australiensis]|nr:dihydrolipoamide acetyltransferase family protein [Chlamydiales bacterium]